MNIYEKEVDQLFRELPGPAGTTCEWPVIGGAYMQHEEEITRNRQLACKALKARDWFAENGPPDAPPLPLNFSDRDKMRLRGSLSTIVAYYAQSLFL